MKSSVNYDVIIIGAGPAGMTASIYLKRAGISTVEDLSNKTEAEMLKVRNLGKKSFDEVTNKLHSLGLDFAEEE